MPPQNTTGHTPGPWVVANGNHVWFDGSDALSSPRICMLQNAATPVRQLGADEIAANARPIAAAPDLLEALRGVARVADRQTIEFDAARDALSKAEAR